MSKEKMLETDQGIDFKLQVEEFDKITNRISLGGDERGYYMVTRVKSRTDAIKILEQALKIYRADTLDMAGQLARTSAMKS